MDDFTLVHDVCGKTATLVYYEDEDWAWDGEDETRVATNRLRFDCPTCNISVEIAPQTY
jgi:hypothetical protein